MSLSSLAGTTWQLAAFSVINRASGEAQHDVLGPHGHGQILYSADGYMSAQLLEGHPLSAHVLADGTDPTRPGLRAITSYAGPYSYEDGAGGAEPITVYYRGEKHAVDVAGTVHHDVRVCIDANWEGTRQTRNVGFLTIDGEPFVALRPPEPWKVGNDEVYLTLLWKRAPKNA
ncbi:hypothetical protein FA10DRAFT_263401 [Acaromyces ingoldii]|uniref:Lipocalin-like domain-containing protein n=1 Tax=Acaromyces ingoldii TaxID=215250 RepID=A0A316YTU0_9BASI|nr:hypothetical protein FA10DRAFT_263401 [Acaromyces ingoldii]PWN92631.1 hypothetical protein FA10DRAFT_263401 [Acaromyces ingoldii]